MTKILLSKLFQMLEIEPRLSLAKGLAWKILFLEMWKPRPMMLLLSLPAGIYFAIRFVAELIINDVHSIIALAVSNFSLSAEYIADQILFINDFFPYQTFLWMMLVGAIFIWSGWSAKKQFNHIIKMNHII